MSYWPGELVQTLSINGNQLSINPGNSVTLPNGGSASNWSQFPALQDVNMGNNGLSNLNYIQSEANFNILASGDIVLTPNSGTVFITGDLQISTINGQIPGSGSGSTISTFQDFSISSLTVSSINGAVPGSGTVLSTFNDLYTSSLVASTLNSEVANISTINSEVANISTINSEVANISTLIGSTINIDVITCSTLTSDFANISSLNTSSINGIEFVGGQGIIVSSITTNTIVSDSVSTIAAEIRQGLFSSIVFNPTVNPQFNISVDTGFSEIGAGLGAIGAGLLGLVVTLPVAGYQLGFGLGKGLNSATEPRAINNINTNNYEVYNYASQLQVSTLGTQVSTIFRTIETVASTIMDSNGSTLATSTNIEVFTSTVSSAPPFLAMRAVADPLQFVSTPWSFEQMLSDDVWVEIPASGLSSNVSTLSLSTLTLAPSTIIKGDLDGAVMEVLEAGSLNDYGEIKTAGYWVTQSTTDPNFGIYVRNSSNLPAYINSNLSTFTIAYDNRAPTEFFVATNGSDTTGTGSFNNPFKTIQTAITAAEAVSSGANQVVITVAPGQYTENITFSKGYVSLVGVMNTQDGNQITSLNGNITVNCGFSDDLVARQVILQGLQIDGVLSDTSPNQHTLVIQDCKFFDTDTLLLVNPSAANQRTFITNTEFVQTTTSTLPVIDVRVGQLQIERIDVDNSTNNTTLLSVSGTASVARCNLCNFESGTTATTTAAAIITVSSTSAFAHSFGFTNIYYTSSSNKTGSANATGIQFTSATTMTAIVINCVFSLVGTSDLANNYIIGKVGAGIITLLQANNQALPAAAGSATKIDPGFVRADYVDPAITAGSISSITINTSTITTNTASATSINATSGFFNSLGVSTLTVNSNIDYQPGTFVNKIFLSGGVANASVIETDVLVSPYIDTVTYIQGFTNSTTANGYIVLASESGLMGINKIPDPGFILDVDSTIRTKVFHASGQIFTSSIVAPSTFIEVKSLTGEVALTPDPSWWVGVNSGVVAGDNQGKIKFGISETETTGYNGAETYLGTKVYPGFYDSGWTGLVGRPIRVEYAVTLDNSFPSGNGQAQFVLPIGFSTLQSFQATLVAFGDNNPGFNTPCWLYSTINDGNGLISTLQVAGEANAPVFVSALGYV
jgi:hypothetical protein